VAKGSGFGPHWGPTEARGGIRLVGFFQVEFVGTTLTFDFSAVGSIDVPLTFQKLKKI